MWKRDGNISQFMGKCGKRTVEKSFFIWYTSKVFDIIGKAFYKHGCLCVESEIGVVWERR